MPWKAHGDRWRIYLHAWDGMKRAIVAVQGVRDGTFKWVENAGDGK